MLRKVKGSIFQEPTNNVVMPEDITIKMIKVHLHIMLEN